MGSLGIPLLSFAWVLSQLASKWIWKYQFYYKDIENMALNIPVRQSWLVSSLGRQCYKTKTTPLPWTDPFAKWLQGVWNLSAEKIVQKRKCNRVGLPWWLRGYRVPAVLETWVQFLDWEDPLEKKMATQSSILAWKIPWMVEPGRLQSTGSQRVGHDWAIEQ